MLLNVVDGKAQGSGLLGETATIVVGEAAVEGDELRTVTGKNIGQTALGSSGKEENVDRKGRGQLLLRNTRKRFVDDGHTLMGKEKHAALKMGRGGDEEGVGGGGEKMDFCTVGTVVDGNTRDGTLQHTHNILASRRKDNDEQRHNRRAKETGTTQTWKFQMTHMEAAKGKAAHEPEQKDIYTSYAPPREADVERGEGKLGGAAKETMDNVEHVCKQSCKDTSQRYKEEEQEGPKQQAIGHGDDDEGTDESRERDASEIVGGERERGDLRHKGYGKEREQGLEDSTCPAMLHCGSKPRKSIDEAIAKPEETQVVVKIGGFATQAALGVPQSEYGGYSNSRELKANVEKLLGTPKEHDDESEEEGMDRGSAAAELLKDDENGEHQARPNE